MATSRYNPNSSNLGGGLNFGSMLGAGGGLLGAGLGSLFGGWENPYEAAQGYYDQLPGMFNPYMQAGQRQLPGLEKAYGEMVGQPGEFINRVGGAYQKSPGYDWALKQALQGAGHAAAAGGMAGSPQHEFENMGIATQMANQDYMNWLKTALGQHGLGLAGQQGLYQTGFRGAEDIASIIAQQAQLEAAAKEAENQRSGGLWGSILGGLGTLAGGLLL